ncbi:Fe(3+) dicitrate ABC transporter ATP-binding protein FecE [Reinekea marinisedimentorum]|uniref:Iron complex transport system ATP-binding protein n=1 Tax=Reinekea marinisedimentorum TaxID=230495 RepID=A0A4R3I4S1_9GAMM|nr:Fe(3+) dicitrate ABC transporter ATP-binding protein FecE [Reinekea marinisedimentorum]TCS38979.1 iron complex transport system ATP-binding protein [Reinekea marinisedimentorum]
MLSTENLSIGYHGQVIVKDVSFTVPHGKITALLGPNGCGKSTLLKALSRTIKPVSGHVYWQQKDVQNIAHKEYARLLAMLPQVQPIPEGLTTFDLIAYGRSPHNGFWGRLSQKDRAVIDQVMAASGVTELADKRVSELSGGQRQRVWLAMTLAQETPYILLDEPTTYMDLNHQVELLGNLRRLNHEGKTIVTVLHDINQAARYCDYLLVMHNGELVAQGTPAEVINQKLLKEVFAVNAQIFPDPVANTPMCVVDD